MQCGQCKARQRRQWLAVWGLILFLTACATAMADDAAPDQLGQRANPFGKQFFAGQDVPQPLPSERQRRQSPQVPRGDWELRWDAPGSREHQVWSGGYDVQQLLLQLQKMGGETGAGGYSSLDERWQRLMREHLERLGLRTPEEQRRWLEAIQADPVRWQRFLEGIQRRLSQDGQEVPPLPPLPRWPNHGTSISPVTPPATAPPGLPTDVDAHQFLNSRTPVAPELPEDRQRSWEALRGWWERYIGPLEATPEVRELLMQAIAGSRWNWDFRDNTERSLRDALPPPSVDQDASTSGGESGLASAEGGEGRSWWRGWRWPRLGSWVPRWGGGRLGGDSVFSWHASSDGTTARRLGYVLLAMGAATLAIAGVWLRLRERIRRQQGSWLSNSAARKWQATELKQVQTREELVRAFEAVSLQLLGPAVRSWTAGAIVRVLPNRVAVSREQLQWLAQVYEQARYAPPVDEFPPQVWSQARTILCQLAGVSSV